MSNLVTILVSFSFLAKTLAIPIPAAEVNSQAHFEHQISLQNRYENTFVNNVFKDNILLNLAYMQGKITSGDQIDWNQLRKPFEYTFTLAPGKTFAFHDDVLEEYQDRVTKTSQTHFNWQEGFKSDGYLTGDGVCHLASLIYWVALDADLNAQAPTNHNFRKINDVPKEYGVSIYYLKGAKEANAKQNLYITNDFANPVEFKFSFANDILNLSISQLK